MLDTCSHSVETLGKHFLPAANVVYFSPSRNKYLWSHTEMTKIRGEKMVKKRKLLEKIPNKPFPVRYAQRDFVT